MFLLDCTDPAWTHLELIQVAVERLEPFEKGDKVRRGLGACGRSGLRYPLLIEQGLKT